MGLPPIISSAKATLDATLFRRLLGTSSSKSSSESSLSDAPLPKLKFKLGEEPSTPRTGSPGFQDGHWVIARPKLATPTIYQHGRSPSSDHNSLGLGIETRPTTPWSENDNWKVGGYAGEVQPWDDDGDERVTQYHDRERDGQGKGKRQEEALWHFVDNPALDGVKPYVEDLYLANARPRIETNSVCFRRQRENASTAAGALTNTLGGIDLWTNQPPRPMDKAGEDRIELLEVGARMLIRSLEGEFPSTMRTRAAAALHKVLTFQDVRERVADVSPLAIAPLVELLRQEASTETEERRGPEGQHQQQQQQQQWNERSRNNRRSQQGELPRAGGGIKKAPLYAALCLRVLALSEGFPEELALSSASVIPGLIDGLTSDSVLMKSTCGGCLASIAPGGQEACLEMIDFGIMSPLLELARSGDPLRELTAWNTLAAIMHAPEAQYVFLEAGGLADLEGILIRKLKRRGSNNVTLLVCQANAMNLLLKLCEGSFSDQDSGYGSSFKTGPTTITTAPSSTSFSSVFDEDSDKIKRTGREVGRLQKGVVEDDPFLPMLQAFFSRGAIFGAILRQMRVGTSSSVAATTEVFRHAWKDFSKEQVDMMIPHVLDMLTSNVWKLKSAAAQVILHVFVEDDQRLKCAESGAIVSLVDMVGEKPQDMQGGTLAALLSLCEHIDVPMFVMEAGGLSVLAEFLTTGRDIATRLLALALMKIISVCDKPAVEPYFPDMLMTEHVLGVSDDVEDFVKVFEEKRKAAHSLTAGEKSLPRFVFADIVNWKRMLQQSKKLVKDAINNSGAIDEGKLKRSMNSKWTLVRTMLGRASGR